MLVVIRQAFVRHMFLAIGNYNWELGNRSVNENVSSKDSKRIQYLFTIDLMEKIINATESRIFCNSNYFAIKHAENWHAIGCLVIIVYHLWRSEPLTACIKKLHREIFFLE